MNKVKKIIILLSIVMLIVSIFASKTYAAISCNVSISKPKEQVTYKEKFSVYVAISNLQTTKGIIAIGAVLSYDTNSLTLVDIEGENKWSDPLHNESNGKMTSFKNKLSTNNENVFKITFEVNEKGKAGNSAWIKIDNFEISDGDEEKNCGGSSIDIAIGEKSSESSGNNNQNENNQGGSSDNNNQGGTSQGGISNNNQNGSSSGSNNQGSSTTKKPSTGSNTTKKPSNSSTNKNDKDNNKEEVTNNNSNNVETNTIGNVIEDDTNNNVIQNNNIQNNIEDNITSEETKAQKENNKGMFYIVSIVTIVAIAGILLLISKYWKTN